MLTIMSAGHALHVFINGQLTDNPKLTYTGNVKLWAGSNTISCLSISVGLPVSATADSTLGNTLYGPSQIQFPISLHCRM
uniref:Uncharacterized protein n=1 Tax=Arundo donax TaxID=35708 RepID=A0A0A9CNQ4_ARUDO